MGFWASTDKHLQQSPITGQLFYMTTFCIAFCESYLSTAYCNQIQEHKKTNVNIYDNPEHEFAKE